MYGGEHLQELLVATPGCDPDVRLVVASYGTDLRNAGGAFGFYFERASTLRYHDFLVRLNGDQRDQHIDGSHWQSSSRLAWSPNAEEDAAVLLMLDELRASFQSSTDAYRQAHAAAAAALDRLAHVVVLRAKPDALPVDEDLVAHFSTSWTRRTYQDSGTMV
jgi:hypothetical protein